MKPCASLRVLRIARCLVASDFSFLLWEALEVPRGGCPEYYQASSPRWLVASISSCLQWGSLDDPRGGCSAYWMENSSPRYLGASIVTLCK